MDYLQELRRRQQAALTRLLTGGRSEEETAAEETSRRAAERSGEGPAGREDGDSRPTAEQQTEQGKRSVQTKNEEAPAVRRRWNGEKTAIGLPAALSEQAEAFRQMRRADTVWRTDAASGEHLPGILLTEWSEPAMEAEDLSRAVQRDARRYDGGFTIF